MDQRDFEEEEFNLSLMEEEDWEELDAVVNEEEYADAVLSDIPEWMLA